MSKISDSRLLSLLSKYSNDITARYYTTNIKTNTYRLQKETFPVWSVSTGGEGELGRKNGYDITKMQISPTRRHARYCWGFWKRTTSVVPVWSGWRSRRNQHARVEPDVMGTSPDRRPGLSLAGRTRSVSGGWWWRRRCCWPTLRSYITDIIAEG